MAKKAKKEISSKGVPEVSTTETIEAQPANAALDESGQDESNKILAEEKPKQDDAELYIIPINGLSGSEHPLEITDYLASDL
jgi:thymidylate synthase ThyX